MSKFIKVSRKSGRRGFPSVAACLLIAGGAGLIFVLVSPVVAAYRQNGRIMDAKHDVHRIAEGMAAMVQDTGIRPYVIETIRNQHVFADVELFIGPGTQPRAATGYVPAMRWTEGHTDSIGAQLIKNTSGYAVKDIARIWRGPYLTEHVGTDPWGHAYLINIKHLASPGGAREESEPIMQAVYALSAGPNGVIETPYQQPVTDAALGGDDIGCRIQ